MPRPWTSCVLILDPECSHTHTWVLGKSFQISSSSSHDEAWCLHGAGLAHLRSLRGKRAPHSRLSTAVADAWRSLTLHLDSSAGYSGKALRSLAWTKPPHSSRPWRASAQHHPRATLPRGAEASRAPPERFARPASARKSRSDAACRLPAD
jgi:hypothetical protein